ncbi:MAG TPA: hypothetical protein VGK05_08510 [Acidimicrobiia bacterium]|jgi:hypothetical protein
MKVAAGVLAAAVLFVAGVLIGTGRGTSSSPAPRVVELGRAPVTVPPTTGAPTTAAPTTAAPPTRTPPTTAPRPPETVERRVEYGGLDDYGGNSGKGSSGSGSGSSGSGSSGSGSGR